MRFVSLIPAVLALFFANAACAQEWDEYVNRENFFTVNFPGEPTMQQVPYSTAKGTKLTARVFTAKADPKSILAGTYSMTVVDYASAPRSQRPQKSLAIGARPNMMSPAMSIESRRNG